MSKAERIEALGELKQKLRCLADNDLFDSLSKHDPYWNGEVNSKDLECKYGGGTLTVENVLADRLDSVRMKLSFIADEISDCLTIAIGDED